MVGIGVLEPPAESAVLLAEDETLARITLTQLLERRGYAVMAASNGRGAVVKAREGNVGVALMDIALGDDLDGIDAAEQIHSDDPLTSFIFLTAHSQDDSYRSRVQASPIRVGGWLPKPIDFDELVRLIEAERSRLELVSACLEAQKGGVDPAAYLLARADLDPSIPRDIVAGVLKELKDSNEEHNAPRSPLKRRVDPMLSVSTQIDELYDQIRALVVRGSSSSRKDEQLSSLRLRLRKLEEIEADLVEANFRGRLEFDAEEASEAEARARRLLSGL